MTGLYTSTVKRLQHQMIDATGGIHGIRDEGLLLSAIHNAYSTFDGVDLYPSVVDKAAVTCFSLIRNHPFVDGNKRTGIFVLLMLLELNDVSVVYSQRELTMLGFGIAEGSIGLPSVVDWVEKHMVH